MRQRQHVHATALFAREWSFALGLMIALGATLFVYGHRTVGTLAIGLSAAALVLRRNALRKQGRSFYGRNNP